MFKRRLRQNVGDSDSEPEQKTSLAKVLAEKANQNSSQSQQDEDAIPKRRVRKIKRNYESSNQVIESDEDPIEDKKDSDEEFDPASKRLEKMKKKILGGKKKKTIELDSDLAINDD